MDIVLLGMSVPHRVASANVPVGVQLDVDIPTRLGHRGALRALGLPQPARHREATR